MTAASTAAVAGFISIEQYLNTTYRPDVDYVDGYIEERNVGETDHSKTQKQLIVLLSLREEEWKVVVMPEVRMQVAAARYRIPDVCVVREGDADEPIVTATPLLCLEVLSPRDSLAGMRRRAQDYFAMGVPEVWIFDPQTRTAHVCLPDSMTEHKEGIIRLGIMQIELSVEEVFKPLQRKS